MIFSYTRVSTDEQARPNAVSPEEQDRKNKLVAQMRGGSAFDVVTYSDNGVSGSISLSKRPQGKLMLEAAKKKDIIIAAKLDRIFRSVQDALYTIELLKERGIELILGDISTEPLSQSAVSKLFFTILASFAEFERARIIERISEGHKGKRAKGGFPGGSAPFGYRVEGRGRKAHLLPISEEQAILDRVAQYQQEEITLTGMVHKLTSLGIHSRTGQPFQVTQVQRMIKSLPLRGASQ